MRMYRPPKLSDDDTWDELHLPVLPVTLRRPILKIAHEDFAGHLGVCKTYVNVLNEFYWSGLEKDVTKFANSCYSCQIVGKRNQTIPPYPLQSI